MLYFIKNKKVKNLMIICLTYILIQGFLLIVTGRWFDDWCFYNQDDLVLKQWSLDMGRPEIIYIMRFIRLFPQGFDRTLTFIMFLYISLFFYQILVEGINLSHNDSVLATLLLTVIPFNSERICLCIFPYTIGLFLFVFGFLKLIYLIKNNELIILNRLLILALFLLSFILNSNLVFYGIVLLYIIYKNKSVKCLIRYIDFIILPIVFFVLKNKLFPTSGLYVSYNSIKLKSLIKASILVAPSCIFELWNTLVSLFTFNSKLSYILFGISIAIILLLNFKVFYRIIKCTILNKNNAIFNGILNDNNRYITYLFTLFIGIICLCCGLFPYIAIRETFCIVGRDLILAPFGLSLILFSLISIFNKKFFINSIVIVFVIYSIGYFCFTYLNYQNAYYRIKGLQYQFSINRELESYKTLLYTTNDNCYYEDRSFYALNAAIEDVYNNQNRFIMGSRYDLSYIDGSNEKYTSKDFVISKNYHMNNFDYNYKDLDIVLVYGFKSGLIDTINLRLKEIFNKKSFENEIKKRSSLAYYLKGSEQYNNVLKQ